MPDPSSQTIPARGMPIPFITAAWSGMSYDAIVAGLHAGSVLPPPGAPADWMPQPGTVGVAYSPAVASAQAAVTDTAQAAATDGAEVAQATSAPGRDDVARWFSTLDPSLSTAGFDAIWQRAGTSDAQRADNLTSYLARTLLGAPPATVDQQGSASSDVGVALDAFLADSAHRAQVVDLATMNGSELAAQGASDVGVRYALAHMDSVALTGNRSLFAMSNADGALDRFDRDTGEALVSESWLEDRGKFLAWKLANDQGNELAVAGSEDWTFVDRATSDAQGEPLTLQLRTGAADAGQNQVVFGTDGTDVMKGLRGSDRMYGGSGEDVLLGGAGGDHLEGGAGADVVMGGAGSDELLGNQGDDELDGGAGADTIQAGSGDDVITGGRGNDRLDGGLGHDTYALDAGDGDDTIVDSDGIGSIELDGNAVAGSMALADDGGWTSADGRVEFTFDGDAAEGGTLTLRAFASGADRTGTPDNVVRVKDWKNGDLGITLSGDLEGVAAETAAAAPTASADSESVAAEAADVANSGGFAGEGVIAASDSLSTEAETATAMTPAGEAPADADIGADASGAAGADGAGADTGASSADDAASSTAAAAESSTTDAFDFDSVLTSLFATDSASVAALDPAALKRGVEAFSGVLAPPDVSESVATAATFDVDGITSAHLADALAADTAGDDFHAEAAMAPAFDTVEMRATDALAARIDKSAARNGAGV